jgi:hypothetical protein
MKDIKFIAETKGYYEAYARGKDIFSRIVGYEAYEGIPSDFRTTEAYDVVLEKLVSVCEEGDKVYQAHLAEERDLELHGIYRNKNAEKMMCCFKKDFEECSSLKCMAWRRTDTDYGYCVLLGRPFGYLRTKNGKEDVTKIPATWPTPNPQKRPGIKRKKTEPFPAAESEENPFDQRGIF